MWKRTCERARIQQDFAGRFSVHWTVGACACDAYLCMRAKYLRACSYSSKALPVVFRSAELAANVFIRENFLCARCSLSRGLCAQPGHESEYGVTCQ